MNIRESLEQREKEILRSCASFSMDAIRDRQEEKCDIRTDYQRDRDRIIHCKAFRRMKDKTQVFLAATGDHYRNRLTHTLEVTQLARTIAKSLRLNEELTEAIGYGHDLGHTPFGHAGEAALDEELKMMDGNLRFKHYLQSLRVVEVLEKNGQGLNLTQAVRDGIKNHGTAGSPSTLEGKIVRLCDKIAYINHDIDDAIRAGILREEDLPQEYTDIMGKSVRERLNNLVHDVILNSVELEDVVQSEQMAWAMSGLRQFMFEQVYYDPDVKKEEQRAKDLLKKLFDWYLNRWQEMPEEYRLMASDEGTGRVVAVCDYIAGMTDHYAVARFQELFVPKFWNGLADAGS